MIQLQPSQISFLWENIRQSALKSSRVPESKVACYSTQLLKNLLSGKFQCWVVFSEERKIVAICITALLNDQLFNAKTLSILSLYGYRHLTDSLAQESWEKLRVFAQRENCDSIIMSTQVPRIQELAKLVGLEKEAETYKLTL